MKILPDVSLILQVNITYFIILHNRSLLGAKIVDYPIISVDYFHIELFKNRS
jgi:hypothetical protein